MWQSVPIAIVCLVLAIVGLVLIACLAAIVRFQIDEPAFIKRPHPIRLTIFIFVCACCGLCLTGVSGGRGQDVPTVWDRVMPLIYGVCGALGGIATELLVRWGQRD
jgi:hypothetical protein